MSRFIVEPLQLGDDRYMVKDTIKGWFIPMPNKRQAEFVKERFDDILKESNND